MKHPDLLKSLDRVWQKPTFQVHEYPSVLGLRKPPGPSTRSTPGGCPPSHEIAIKICRPATRSS